MKRKIHVTEATKDGNGGVVIASVGMSTDDTGRRVVTWVLEDTFHFSDPQMQSMQNATAMLNTLTKKGAIE